jgi:hypothetical protein
LDNQNYQNQGQQSYQQPVYQGQQAYQAPPMYNAPPSRIYSNGEMPVSLGEWIITWIVLGIPLVGIIMLFVWAFGSDTKRSKKTYCQATLIISLAITVLSVFFFFVFGGLAAFIGSGSYYY